MKKILTLNIKQLRTEESFGYQKQVVAETANLPIGEETGTPSEISQLSATNPVLEAKVNDFTTAVDAFRRCVEGILHESRHSDGYGNGRCP